MALDTSQLNTQNELRRTVDAVRTLLGQAGTGQGSTFAPKLVGSTQVPIVNALKIIPLSDSFLGSEFLLTWEDLPRSYMADRYNIYARRITDTDEPQLIASVNKAPARVRVGGAAASPVVFWVQTQLSNGFSSPRELSATATGVSTQSQIADDDIASVSITKLIATGPAVFTSTATFSNGSYLLEIASTGIRMSDGTRNVNITGSAITLSDGTASVVVNSSGNIVLTRGSRTLTINSTSLVLSDGTATVSLNSSGNIVLDKGTTNVTISTGTIVLTNGTQSASLSSSGASFNFNGSRYLSIDGTGITITDGTGSLTMTGSLARIARGSFKLDLTATYIEITDGTNYNRITATQQILNGGQIIVNGTAGTDPVKLQRGGSDKFVVASGGIVITDEVLMSHLYTFQHGTTPNAIWATDASGNQSFVSLEVVNGSDAFRHNGVAGLTATRTALDSGSVSRTVTISGGLITGWTT